MRVVARAATAAALCAAACGGQLDATTPTSDAAVDGAHDASPEASVDATPEAAVDAAPDADADPDAGAACEALADALSAKVAPVTGSCTTVVRVSEPSLTVVGYRMFCGPYAHVTEAEAQTRSQAETGVGFPGCFQTPSITGSAPADDFVFFQPASAAACACCGDGWLTAVGVRNGLTVLGANITLAPSGGGVVFPATWDPPGDLGTGCAQAAMAPIRGFDLVPLGPPYGPPPRELTVEDVRPAVEAVWRTALPAALWKRGYVFDTVVLRIAPSTFDFALADVIVNSGWLE